MSKQLTDQQKIIRQHLLRVYNGDMDSDIETTIIGVTAVIDNMISQAERSAVFNYRASIIQEHYDTMLKTYDIKGIGETVLGGEEL